jgi:EAL domain-containing protein (putative c-di-GMP-specific phosphodiesterase class I)/GGDEF domain-containing protein
MTRPAPPTDSPRLFSLQGALSQRASIAAEVSGQVTELMAEGQLSTHFQPLGWLRDGEVMGHEALLRGPRGHMLSAPDALFAAAASEGVSFELEVQAVKLALMAWRQQGMPGHLFVNLSAGALTALLAHPVAHGIWGLIQAHQLPTQQLVVEITEHERVADLSRLLEAVEVLKRLKVQLALDDFGDGRSSLRLWAELKPEFVKIDKYFTRDIATHPDKVQTITALRRIAETFGTQMVAEGIESTEELRVLRDLGIELGQGYLLGRPQPAAVDTLLPEAREVIHSRQIAVLPSRPRQARHDFTLEALSQPVEPLPADATHRQAAKRFLADEHLKAVALVRDGRPVGLVNRQGFFNHYSRPYFKELYDQHPCLLFANTEPLMLEAHIGLEQLTDVLTSEDQRYLSEGFIVTRNGRYHGMGTGERLVRAVTELRIEAARHANPLTFLPGNIPLTLHIARLLQMGTPFVACYADLNHFKPFNDHYGYWRGDEMICLLARTLVAHCDPLRDFVGHVGGDDFVVLFQSEDWRQRIETLVAAFNSEAQSLFDEEARGRGGIEAEDRDGVMRFFPMTTLSAGVVPVGGGTFAQPEMVASAAAVAKHKAKQKAAGLHVEPWVVASAVAAQPEVVPD